MPRVDIQAKFIVAAAVIPGERMPEADHSC
jgi:hypothetical protein